MKIISKHILVEPILPTFDFNKFNYLLFSFIKVKSDGSFDLLYWYRVYSIVILLNKLKCFMKLFKAIKIQFKTHLKNCLFNLIQIY